MSKKKLGDDFGFKDLDKFKWKNPPVKPRKLIPNLPPPPLPAIDNPGE